MGFITSKLATALVGRLRLRADHYKQAAGTAAQQAGHQRVDTHPPALALMVASWVFAELAQGIEELAK